MHNPADTGRLGQIMRADPRRCRRGAWRRLQGVVLAALVTCSLASLADSTRLGTFRHWTAISYSDGDGTSCMIWSEPEALQENMGDREGVYVFVTHRSSPPQFDAVNLYSGYAFREQSDVEVSIGTQVFLLDASGSNAWTRDASDNEKMARAMRAGLSMTVEGTSADGKRVVDTYSLLGFSAAHNAINEACGRGSGP